MVKHRLLLSFSLFLLFFSYPYTNTKTLYASEATTIITDTNYTYPTNALFVSPSGNDTNNGSFTSPFKTIAKAVSSASNGNTIVIRGGTYRENTLNFGSKVLTLQPSPHEQVLIKGSLLATNWTHPTTSYWQTDWAYNFTQDADSNAITTADPYAGYPEMVIIDGQMLKQVGSLQAVTTGTFYFDQTNSPHRMYIGSDPAGKTVEITAYKMALNLANNTGSVIRGLGFMHYAPGYGPTEAAMVRIDGSSTNTITFEDNTFAYSGGRGLALFGVKPTLRGNTFIYNGNSGVDTYETSYLLVENNTFSHNNQKNFDVGWDAAGIKISRSDYVQFRDNTIEDNASKGLWFDGYCNNATIVRNRIQNNAHSGIKYEISSFAIIASNIVTGNSQHGINIGAGSDNVKVYNNTLSKNKQNMSVVDSADDPRKTFNNIFMNNIVSNNDGSSSALMQVVDYTSPAQPAATLLNTSDYNDYFRTSTSTPSALVSWCNGSSCTNYTSLSSFRSGASRETNGYESSATSTNPFFIDEANGNYNLKQGSHPQDSGEPLTDQTVVDAINSGLAKPLVSLNTAIDRGAILGSSALLSPTSTLTPKPGDGNLDGKVDGIDYITWLNHYNQNVSGPSNGDFNNDGKVDGVDYITWLNNYGK
jgi:parallel beta-helix repeat protein